MKRENTVKAHSEYDRIIHNGVKVKSTHFSLFGEKTETSVTRIGLAVGKANGKAVQRVRVKRQVRAMVVSANLDYSLPMNLIIVIRPNFKTDEFTENERELHALLDRMKELLK